MPRERKIFPLIVNAAIFILLEIAALNMLRHNSELQSLWLSRISHTFMAKVWGGSDRLRHYFSLTTLLAERPKRMVPSPGNATE